MEVFGTVASAIDLGCRILGYLRDVVGCPQERRDFEAELSIVTSLLIIFSNQCDTATSFEPWKSALCELEKEDGPLDQFQKAMAKASDTLSKHRILRIATWTWTKQYIMGLLSRIEKLKTAILSYFVTMNLDISRGIKVDNEAIRMGIEKIERGIETVETGIRASAEDTKVAKAMDWISSTRYPAKYQDVLHNRTDGTGRWFLETLEFKKWLRREEICLLCSGDPGTGKTILAATAIEYIMKTDKTATVAYIFCDYQNKDAMHVPDYLSALLQQIVGQNAGRNVSATAPLLELYDQFKDKRGKRPTEDEIRRTLIMTIARALKVHIVIDALDECPEDVREELMHSVTNLTKSQQNISLLMTSRPLPSVISGLEERYPSMLTVQVTADPSDVRAYVRSFLGTQRALKRDPQLSILIEDTIAEAVRGLFLLAKFLVGPFKNMKSLRQIEAELGTMSQSSNASSGPSYRYKEMYTRWMDRIEGQDEYDKDLAKQALALVVCSKRALTPEELRYALAIYEGDTDLNERGLCDIDDVISSCEGLIVIKQETDTVELVHYTAQEFFNAYLSNYFPEGELYIASTCMTALNFASYTEIAESWRICATFDENPTLEENAALQKIIHEQFEKLPFLRYAAFFWPQHIRICGQKLLGPAISFVESGPRFRFLFYQAWSQFEDYIPYPENKSAWLHDEEILLLTCAGLGLTAIYEAMLNSNPEKRVTNLNSIDYDGRTALYLAARVNHAELVGFLIKQQGLNLTLGPGSRRGLTPLGAACQEGNQEVVAELLKHPDLTVRTRAYALPIPRNSPRFDLPIHIATRYGHLGLVKHLIETEEYGEDADAENGEHETPLYIACHQGHKEIVSYLLGRGVKVNTRTLSEKTPLQAAIMTGCIATIRMLLQRKDVDLELRMGRGRTALHQAVQTANSIETSKLLLQLKDLDIEARDDDGNTPLLMAASATWHVEMDLVDFLIRQGGANVHARNNGGETLLHVAVKGGRVHSLRHLIETYELDIATEDNNGLTPIEYALNYTQLELLNFLFDIHLKGARLEIIGQCRHVSDKGYGEYIMRRYKCSLTLTKTHPDCGLCTKISERLHTQSFYLDEDHALVEEARELWPLTWCINPKGEESEESDSSVIETKVSPSCINPRSEELGELGESDDNVIETTVSTSCVNTKSEELEEAEESDGSVIETEVSRMILIAE